MNHFVFRLFARNSVSCWRTHTCTVISPSPKMLRLCNFHKCFSSSTTSDLSKLSDSLAADDFDFDDDRSVLKIDVNAITKGDPEKLKALQATKLQVEVLRLQELEMPSSLSTDDWKNLMTLTSFTQRKNFLYRLWVKEMQAKVKKVQQRERQESYKKFKSTGMSAKKVLTTSSPIEYALNNVFLFHLIRDNSINQFYNYQLLQAEWFGPHIILDCGYDLFMTPKNLAYCVKEMLLAWSTNRENPNPFDILFCNFDRTGRMWSKAVQAFPILERPDGPIHHTDQHYLQFFPKEKLVYLTPHCKEVLEEFNPDDVYIIGAYVDFGSCEHLSLAKAKKEGLRKAKLPLDKYLKWKRGSKSLSLRTVLAIINELKNGQSWPEALKHVPKKHVELKVDFDSSYDEPEYISRLTAESIRQDYRKNLVYDLLLNNSLKRPSNDH